MPIDGAYNSLAQMMRIKQAHETQQAVPDKDNSVSSSVGIGERLAQLADTISLSVIDPKIKKQLEAIAEQGGNVASVLEENVSQIQDAFIGELRHNLEQAGIALDEKITLHMRGDTLQVASTHSKQQRINNMLATNDVFSETFMEIAAQSELVRDLNSIKYAVHATSVPERYQAQASMSGGEYRVSIKGSMSHFYFSSE